MKILVVGRDGQLGRELVEAMAGAGRLVALGRRELDLLDPSAIRRTIAARRPDIVINAAAYTAVEAAEADADTAFAVNAAAPEAMARACLATGAAFLHFSTDYVFDGEKGAPYVETDATAPLNVYGRSKRAGEEAVAAVGGDYLILRTSWLYGRHGRNFLTTILRLAAEKDELQVVADQVGSPTWSGAVAQAVARLVEQRETLAAHPGLYHLAAGGQTSWHGFASKIVEESRRLGVAGSNAVVVNPVRTADYRASARRPRHSALSCDLLASRFGLRLAAWEDDLRSCLAQMAGGRRKPLISPA